jgi:hypothetical protein
VVPDGYPVRDIAAVLDLSWVHSELTPYYPRLGSTVDRSGAHAPKIRSERAQCRDVRVRLPEPAGRGIFVGACNTHFFADKAKMGRPVLDKFQGIAVA